MGVYETRPARPSSIELRRNYPEQVDGGYGPMTPHTAAAGVGGAGGVPSNYPPTSTYSSSNGGILSSQHHQMHLTAQQQQAAVAAATHAHHQQQLQSHHQQQLYDDALYNSQAVYSQTGPSPLSPESLYAPGTPSRTKPRPSQPPPAPPSNDSGGGTPNASNANTPTRGRSMSTTRDTLPPPPPIPDSMTSPLPLMAPINGGNIAAKLLARTNSTSRAGSPQLAPSTSVQDANALVMAQLSNQINNFNSMSLTISQQMNSLNDLPPPPPVPDQVKLIII